VIASDTHEVNVPTQEERIELATSTKFSFCWMLKTNSQVTDADDVTIAQIILVNVFA
jgi:hypothetical protein